MTHRPDEEEIMRKARDMQEARDRLRRQINKLIERNSKASETKAEKAETLKGLEEKYNKLLMASHGYSQGWTGTDSAKYEEARKAIEKIAELEKKIGILSKATGQQERYQEGVLEVLKKEVDCETKYLEQNMQVLDRKMIWLENLNNEIHGVVQANPILSECRGKSCDMSIDEQRDMFLDVGSPRNRKGSIGRGEISGKKEKDLDVRIAELMRREMRRLSQQGSSKEMSGSPKEEEKKEVDPRPWRHNSKPLDSVVKDEVIKETVAEKRNVKGKSSEKKKVHKKVEDEVEKPEKKEVDPRPWRHNSKQLESVVKEEVKIKVSSPKAVRRESLEPDSLEGSPMRTDKNQLIREEDSFEKLKLKEPVRVEKDVEAAIKKPETGEKDNFKTEDVKKKVEELKVKELNEEIKKENKEIEIIKRILPDKETVKARDMNEIKEDNKDKEEEKEVVAKPERPKDILKKKGIDEIEEEINMKENKTSKKEERNLEGKQEIKKQIAEEKIEKNAKEIQRLRTQKSVISEDKEVKKKSRRDDEFEIDQEFKEIGQDKSELALKPQFFKGRRAEKQITNPLDLKMKNDESPLSAKPLNIVSENKEPVLPTTTAQIFEMEAQTPVERPLLSKPVNAIQENKELFLPNTQSKQTKPDHRLSLSPEKNNTNTEVLELPVTSGVSRRNRFAQDRTLESKLEPTSSFVRSDNKQNEQSKDNSGLNLDYLNQSIQERGKSQVQGLAQSPNKAIANTVESGLSLPFTLEENKANSRRRRIVDAQGESENTELSISPSPQKEMVKTEPDPFEEISIPRKGFGVPQESSKGVGRIGSNASPDEEITKGLQARNRLARLRKGDEVQKTNEDMLSLDVKEVEVKGEEKRGFGKEADPFAKYDEINSENIEVKGKDLFGNKEKFEFGKGTMTVKPKQDLSSMLDQMNEKTDEITVGNARRMRMNQRDRSVKEDNVKEKQTALATKAQDKQNKFFGDLDMEDF